MKITRLADKLLLWFIKELKDSGKQFFDFDYIQQTFREHPEQSLIQAIYLLKGDGLIKTIDADDIPSTTILLPIAIRQVEENTFLKKGYNLAKQIKDLIP